MSGSRLGQVQIFRSSCNILLLPENEQKAMLEEKRRELLDELHTAKEKLDCLDYLRYQYQNKHQASGG